MAANEGDPRFYKILSQMAEVHHKKSADYGAGTDPLANLRASVQFGIPAWIGAMIRAQDKMVRIQSFVRKAKLVNESVEDSLLDLASYAILALILFREQAEDSSGASSNCNG